MNLYLIELVRYLVAQSWQIAVLTLMVAGVTWALRHKTAHIRYLLWLIVLAKCLVPPFFAVPLRVLPEKTASRAITETPAAEPAPIQAESTPTASIPPSRPPAVVEPGRVEQVKPPRVDNRPSRPLDLRLHAGIAWIAGAGLYLAMNLLRALRGRHWLHARRQPLPDAIRKETEALLSTSDGRPVPPIWVLDEIGQPFVWGLLRGSIYVPSRFLELGDPEHRRHVLAHELSHVLRCDAAVNALQTLAQGLFWFHPFVWWANRETRREREKCCDEMAVAQLGAEARAYCHAVVETLASAETSAQPVPSLAVAGPVKNLEERIKTMLTPGKKFYKRPSLISASIVFLAALVTVPTALVLTARAQTEPPKVETNSPWTLHQAAAAGDVEQVKKLLAQGADVNEKEEDGSTPLHKATGNGWKDVARLLLEKGANVEATDASRQTPLHRASGWGSRHMCALLLDKGASVKATDSQGNTVLHAALGRQEVNRSFFEFLLAQGADVNARNEQGETPLHLACRTRRPATYTQQREEAADVLLAHGAEVNATDKSGRTPLHVAVENGQDKVVGLLLAKGAAVDTKNAAGATALHVAATNRHSSDIVELLVNRGADVNSVDPDGMTPLHLAARRHDNETTVDRLLVAKGADVNARAAHGQTPAHLAAMTNRRDTVTFLLSKGADISSIQLAAYLGDLARVKGFLESGVGVNAQDAYSVTPLHAAAQNGQKEVAEFLLSKGASVNLASANSIIPNGTTPLHGAALVGSREVVELLIGNDAEIDAKDKRGITPLYYAARWQTDTARLLIAHGADVNAMSQADGTPLHSAAGYGNKDSVLLLLDHGADINAQNARGMMPSELAAQQGHEDVVRLLIDKGADLSNRDVLLLCACTHQQKDLVELLIRKGADVNSKAWEHAPALQTIWFGYKTPDIPKLIGILRLLLDNGANPNANDSDWYLLHYAARDAEVTRVLLDKGANPNVIDKTHGQSPLHVSATKGCKPAVELLVAHGADSNLKNYDGQTPLALARENGHKEIVEFLQQHGAKE